MRYMLMHKCFAVAELVFDETTGSIIKIGTVYDRDRLPVGVTERNGKADRFLLNEWWRDRSLPDTRQGIKDALYALKISNPQVLAIRGYGFSLSDAYWILPESSNINWYDLNFFGNAFSRTLPKNGCTRSSRNMPPWGSRVFTIGKKSRRRSRTGETYIRIRTGRKCLPIPYNSARTSSAI